MHEYFRNLHAMDPLFHALVESRVREIAQDTARFDLTVDDLSTEDELEILRQYSVTLYVEYRNLRSVLVENMEVLAGSRGWLNRMN